MLSNAKVIAWLARLASEADAEALIDYDQVIKGLVKMKQPHMAEARKDLH